MKSVRLDVLLVERGLCASREEAQAFILAGEVWSAESRLEKAGTKYPDDIPLEVRSRRARFVSRAGDKLHHALQTFDLSVKDRICLDVGASTGGFTDCLLQEGARHVFAVDVGYGQLSEKLRRDPRVTVLEKTNARYLTQETLGASTLSSGIDFVCMDTSFISLEKIVLPLAAAFSSVRDWVLLFKPQFEVGPENLGKGGVVRKPEATQEALARLEDRLKTVGLRLKSAPENSPLAGKKSGNVEILVHYVPATSLQDS